MVNQTITVLGVAALFAGCTLLMRPGTAEATMLTPHAPAAMQIENENLIEVQRRGESRRFDRRRDGRQFRGPRHDGRADQRWRARPERHVRRWEPGRHGPRYRARRPGFQHFHLGFWYAVPWWLHAPHVYAHRHPYYGLSAAHIEWCVYRYRSYRISDNSFQPYHGPRRQCISPYGP